MIIGKLIPAGTGMSRYRNVQVKIKPEAIPEYWLARQREIAEAEAAGEPVLVGITREEAERKLFGGASSSPRVIRAIDRSGTRHSDGPPWTRRHGRRAWLSRSLTRTGRA